MATTKKLAVKTVRGGAERVATPGAVAARVELKVAVEVNKPARIKGGQYDGAVGTVQEISAMGDQAKVLIQGIHKGEPLDVLQWFGAAELVDAS